MSGQSMKREIEFVRNKILASGTDDWVHDAEACFAARQALFGDRLREGFPEEGSRDAAQLASLRTEWTAVQEREALPLALTAIKELVREGLVEIGSVTEEGFVPWSGTVGELEAGIDRVADTATYPILMGDLFWLSNTPLGDEKAAM